MSEPAPPTPAARAKTRDLAAKIVESVERDAQWPEPFTSAFEDERDAVFALSQEIAQLHIELGLALDLAAVPERNQDDDWQDKYRELCASWFAGKETAVTRVLLDPENTRSRK